MTRARDMGVPAYAETCPQYLFLDYSVYEQPGFEGAKYVMTPPIREKWNQEKLWRGLQFNDLQVVSTDHCPFCFKEQKELGTRRLLEDPERRPGRRAPDEPRLQRRRGAGTDPLNRFVEITSTNRREDLRPLPAQGDDRRRQRRRHRHLRSRTRR